MMASVWSVTAEIPSFPRLEGDRYTDVMIIGGGMAGLLCLWRLRQAGVDCVLAEAETLCSGITANTTAKITAQHGLVYHKLLSQLGHERAQAYYRIHQQALEDYRALCSRHNCGFEEQDAWVFARSHPEKLEKELTALQALRIPAELREALPLPFPVAGGIRFPNQAQFHPLRFAAMLSRGLPVLEHTKVLELKGTDAVTDRGTIHAQKVIVATHFPFLNRHGSYFLKLYQHRSYVLALEGGPKLEGMYVDENSAGLSFRMNGESLLMGGCGHRTGKKGGGFRELERLAQRYYPDAVPAARWAAQDCMTLDGRPYIGRYSPRTENLFVATGFGKWGMTGAMAASRVLQDWIMDGYSEYESLFQPSRSMLQPQLLVNGAEAIAHLVLPAARRCPHMGCGLKWNPQEHSWDCPCHGSRFSQSGKLLDNPATGDLPGKKMARIRKNQNIAEPGPMDPAQKRLWYCYGKENPVIASMRIALSPSVVPHVPLNVGFHLLFITEADRVQVFSIQYGEIGLLMNIALLPVTGKQIIGGHQGKGGIRILRAQPIDGIGRGVDKRIHSVDFGKNGGFLLPEAL